MTQEPENKLREDFAKEYYHHMHNPSPYEIADYWLEKVREAESENDKHWLRRCKQATDEARKSERQDIREKIEEYFKGLIAIPNPQATKEKLLNFLKD